LAAGGAALIVALEQLRHDVGEELAGVRSVSACMVRGRSSAARMPRITAAAEYLLPRHRI